MTNLTKLEKALDMFTRALLHTDRSTAEKIFTDISSDISIIQLADDFLSPALERIGDAYEEGAIDIPAFYVIGRICEELLATFLPYKKAEKKEYEIAIVALEDFHSIGKRMIISALQSEGFDVLDYGYGLTVHDVIRKAEEDCIKALLISSHKVSSAHMVGYLTNILKINRSNIKVVVGGAPFKSQKNLWREVGADAVCNSAKDAIGIVKRFVK